MGNSFGELYKIMGDATKVESPFLMGKIKSKLPKLEVETNGIVLDKDDLLIDKWLLDRHYNLGFACDFNNCSGGNVGEVFHDVNKIVKCINFNSCSKVCNKKTDKEFKCVDCEVPCKTDLNFDDRLNIGDNVLMIRHLSKFLIISKVVSI